MIRPLRVLFCLVLPLVVLAGVAGACGSSDSSGASAGGPCVGPQCGTADAGDRDNYVLDVAVPDATPDQEAGAPKQNPLCGSQCVPDDVAACTGFQPEAGAVTDGGSGGGPADASSDAADGAAKDGSNYAPPEAGSGDAAPAVYACHVRRSGVAARGTCEPAGTGAENAPCVSSADCAPGLGCVGEGSAGQCRQFCCKPGGCDADAGSFCGQRPLRDDADQGGAPLMVPVCVPADNCNLAEAYPCTASTPDDCTCKDPTTACMVVGNGITACITPPGDGKAGDACPCAWDHVCSQATQKCLKICSLTAADPGCGAGQCQAAKEMPDGFGVCVGSSAADAG